MQKILYVEDDLSLIDGLQYTLEASGYMVDNAKTVKEALALFRKNTYDLLLLDVTLPDGTGFDVCKAVRNSSTVPIIFLTASDQEISIVRGLDMGADDYITKPFSSTYLKIRIKYLLQQRKQLQELYLKQWSKTLKKTPVPIADIEPTPPQITSFDEEFMKRVMEIMNNQMDNSDFIIDEFAKKLGMGRTVFYQKLKSLTGLSPIDFVREMRIKRAKQLAESGEYNVSTIAYMTGFNDPKYFSKCFKKRYGVSPSEFQNK